MHKTATITWVILIFLTIVSAFVSKLESTYVLLFIIILSALKFLGIAFQFMEMKKANIFWKVLIISFVLTFTATILIIA